MLKNIFGLALLVTLTLSSMMANAATVRPVVLEDNVVAKEDNIDRNVSGKVIDGHEIVGARNMEDTASSRANENSTQTYILLLSLLGFIALSNRRNV